MRKTDLLGSLRALELRLSTSEVTALIRTQSDEVQDEFSHLTLQISIAVSQLERADLTRISEELKANEAGLRTGISDAQRTLIALKSAREIIDTVATVLTTVTGLLALL
jgi:hypothetical protein